MACICSGVKHHRRLQAALRIEQQGERERIFFERMKK